MSIFMDNVACTGTESRLIDCPFDSHTADCVHAEDAGVRCQEGVLFDSSMKYILTLSSSSSKIV